VEIEAAVYQSYSSKGTTAATTAAATATATADEADMLVVAVILENASYAV